MTKALEVEVRLNVKRIIIVILTAVLSGCLTTAESTDRRSLSVETLSTEHWEMPLAPGYAFEYSGGVYTVAKETSVGALQLSTFQKNTGRLSDQEILQIATEEVGSKAELTKIKTEGQRGYSAIFRTGQVIWMYWFVAIDSSLIFITYNVDAKKANDREVLETLKMIDGLTSV